jgi:hypothetical protein
MDQSRIVFDRLEWESPMPGMKVKRFEQGDRCLRLVEFREDFHEPDFCTKKHMGYVLEGSCAIHFADGRSIRVQQGDGLFLAGDEQSRHEVKVDPGQRVLMLLVDG